MSFAPHDFPFAAVPAAPADPNLMDRDCAALPSTDWLRLIVAPATWVYRCWANCLAGCDCELWANPRETVAFPVVERA